MDCWSMGSQRIGHDWVTFTFMFMFLRSMRKSRGVLLSPTGKISPPLVQCIWRVSPSVATVEMVVKWHWFSKAIQEELGDFYLRSYLTVLPTVMFHVKASSWKSSQVNLSWRFGEWLFLEEENPILVSLAGLVGWGTQRVCMKHVSSVWEQKASGAERDPMVWEHPFPSGGITASFYQDATFVVLIKKKKCLVMGSPGLNTSRKVLWLYICLICICF